VLGAATASGTSRIRNHPSCAARGPQQVQSNPWPPAQQQLAPPGPSMINLCRYSGLNSHPTFKLLGNDLVADSQTIGKLVHRFDALKPLPPGQTFACPADDGSQVLATLYYRQHQVTISTELTGCNGVTNGDLERSATNLDNKNPQGPKLLAQLKRLTKRYRVYH
jgi:hypothetical protein